MRACATAHKRLHELAERNDIGWAIRLSVKADSPEDKKTVAATYIMQLVSGTTPGDKRKALHDWYEWMDFEKFKEKYPLKVVLNVKELLTQHEQWMADVKIEYTPPFLLTGTSCQNNTELMT